MLCERDGDSRIIQRAQEVQTDCAGIYGVYGVTVTDKVEGCGLEQCKNIYVAREKGLARKVGGTRRAVS